MIWQFYSNETKAKLARYFYHHIETQNIHQKNNEFQYQNRIRIFQLLEFFSHTAVMLR
jgi:hypothetical protein